MTRRDAVAAGVGLVLLALSAAQFLMTLDSSVMNVSIAEVASDLGTTVTGIQTAITLYTLVMATTMITGGKIGAIIGRRRAFSIGCLVYGAGSLTTALAPNLPVLLIGWSLLEGLGAALILPAVVALIAVNFGAKDRPRAYGTIASAAAIAVAVGPLIGGLVTTYFSWRWVFGAEVFIVMVILALARRVKDAPPPKTHPKFDVAGAVLSAAGLGLIVFGVLRSSEWGWVKPKPSGTALLGVSPTVWLLIAGGLVLWAFMSWENRLEDRGKEPLVTPELLKNRRLVGGLSVFFFQYLLQAGVFFVVPLFLSVALGLSALETGLRILPLSLALLVAAAGVPRVLPHASPRRVVRVGLLLILAGVVVLIAGIDIDGQAKVVAIPMLLLGLGIGALASQLGAVTVSAVPDEDSAEVGGLQNTVTNLGASLGTAIAGSVLIAVLTASLLQGVTQNPAVPQQAKEQMNVKLAAGVPFVSDADLETAMQKAGADAAVTTAVVDANRVARLQGLSSALTVMALLAVIALFFTRRIPMTQPGAPRPPGEAAAA